MEIVLTIGFVLMGFCLPAIFCWGFYVGFGYSEQIFTTGNVKAESIPGYNSAQGVKTTLQQVVAPKETTAERIRRLNAENVENFGTDIPQKEVK